MARIRSLKIGFFTNEILAELSPWHRLLFAGLWLLADREGRLEDRPRRIKAALFPYDELNVDQLLTDLATCGFIARYESADGAGTGGRYLAIVNFLRHQRPNNHEPASLIPAPSVTENRTMHVHASQEWDLDLGNGDGEREGEAADAAAGADGAPLSARVRPEDVQALWNSETHPPIPRCRELSTKRRRQIRSRMSERPLTEWATVFQRIQASAFCRGENDRGWVASFDWVVGTPDVAVKVLEGTYNDRARVERPQRSEITGPAIPDVAATDNYLAKLRAAKAEVQA